MLGKREIGGILKWRGKIRHHFQAEELKKEQVETEKVRQEVMEEENNS